MHRTLYEICAISLLAVDEDAHTREALRKLLPYNYGNQRVIIADDYEQTEMQILQSRPNILILGIGHEKSKAVRLMSIFYSQVETRIIVLSQHSSCSSIDEFIAAGATTFISKPLNIDYLYTAVDKAIESIFLNRINSLPELRARLVPLQEQTQN